MNAEIDDPNGDPEYQEAFVALAGNIATVIRDHMKDPPYRRDKIYQVLNALASQAANILVACDDEVAFNFFSDCLRSNIDHIRDAHQFETPKPKIAKAEGSG